MIGNFFIFEFFFKILSKCVYVYICLYNIFFFNVLGYLEGYSYFFCEECVEIGFLFGWFLFLIFFFDSVEFFIFNCYKLYR